eukprot:4029412-Ditylum_brightwellii.AAC.1
MSNELANLANCSHSESSRLAIRHRQILTEEEKKKEEGNKFLKVNIEPEKETKPLSIINFVIIVIIVNKC